MTGPAIPEKDLRRLVKRQLDQGAVPVLKVDSLDAGYGEGEHCRICSQQITSAQVEYMVPAQGEAPALHFHLKCFAAWQLECVALLEGNARANELFST